jgi:hypothetical protein
VQGAFGVVLGKALARAIPQALKLDTGGTAGLAVQALGAVAAAEIVRRTGFLRGMTNYVLAGGLAAPIESFVKQLNIPLISPALGEYGAYVSPAAYPQLAAGEMTDVFGTDLSGVGAYVQY